MFCTVVSFAKAGNSLAARLRLCFYDALPKCLRLYHFSSMGPFRGSIAFPIYSSHASSFYFVTARNAREHSTGHPTNKVVFPTIALNNFLQLAYQYVAQRLFATHNRFTQV